MTTQPSSSDTLSSHIGRSWLERTQSVNPNSSTNSTSVTEPQIRSRTRAPDIQTIEVSLPDVGAGQAGLDLSQAIHPTIVAKLLSGEPIPKEADQASNDISETPSQQGDKAEAPTAPLVEDENKDDATLIKDEDKNDQQHTATNNLDLADKQQVLDSAIDSLCDKILERFPLGVPSVLQFVGTEPNRHIDEACARIAARLAERNIGRILLLDSDLQHQSLSHASGLSKSNGISDVTNRGVDWKSLVYSGDAKELDFIPGGTHERFRHPEEKSRLRSAVNEMKRDYQFLLVSAGDAHGLSAKIWNDICEGTYLLVSMKHSNETYAQSAVAAIQSSGGRVLGCVLTDVD